MTPQNLHGLVKAADGCLVGEQCAIGTPKEARLRAFQQGEPVDPGSPVRIGEKCLILNQVVIYEGVSIADGCMLEDRTRVGYGTSIGPDSRLIYGAYVCDRVTIGARGRIAGFVCDAAVIGDDCTMMGDLVHEYTRPHEGWWDVDEPSPRVHDESVIGYGAKVVGGVTIGPRSYVAAGATITRDVPAEHVAIGANNFTPIRDWPGKRLRELIRHWSGTSGS
ncbi:acyltransferase [Nocardiopsis lucentensis]|uniref:acyltransferase n=1 Tax=Nocardiopsis lucentensis TaxID=53441 RepID=UPI00034DFCB1|nr:DapH/DapD/GlmU-related protein [Nocardiopsis lucentensis]